jgi:hypothetical protein
MMETKPGFQNVVFLSKNETMEKVQNMCELDNTPLSQSFRFIGGTVRMNLQKYQCTI